MTYENQDAAGFDSLGSIHPEPTIHVEVGQMQHDVTILMCVWMFCGILMDIVLICFDLI